MADYRHARQRRTPVCLRASDWLPEARKLWTWHQQGDIQETLDKRISRRQDRHTVLLCISSYIRWLLFGRSSSAQQLLLYTVVIELSGKSCIILYIGCLLCFRKLGLPYPVSGGPLRAPLCSQVDIPQLPIHFRPQYLWVLPHICPPSSKSS